MRVAGEKTEKVREDKRAAADRRRAGPTFVFTSSLPDGMTPEEAREKCLSVFKAWGEAGL